MRSIACMVLILLATCFADKAVDELRDAMTHFDGKELQNYVESLPNYEEVILTLEPSDLVTLILSTANPDAFLITMDVESLDRIYKILYRTDSIHNVIYKAPISHNLFYRIYYNENYQGYEESIPQSLKDTAERMKELYEIGKPEELQEFMESIEDITPIGYVVDGDLIINVINKVPRPDEMVTKWPAKIIYSMFVTFNDLGKDTRALKELLPKSYQRAMEVKCKARNQATTTAKPNTATEKPKAVKRTQTAEAEEEEQQTSYVWPPCGWGFGCYVPNAKAQRKAPTRAETLPTTTSTTTTTTTTTSTTTTTEAPIKSGRSVQERPSDDCDQGCCMCPNCQNCPGRCDSCCPDCTCPGGQESTVGVRRQERGQPSKEGVERAEVETEGVDEEPEEEIEEEKEEVEEEGEECDIEPIKKNQTSTVEEAKIEILESMPNIPVCLADYLSELSPDQVEFVISEHENPTSLLMMMSAATLEYVAKSSPSLGKRLAQMDDTDVNMILAKVPDICIFLELLDPESAEIIVKKIPTAYLKRTQRVVQKPRVEAENKTNNVNSNESQENNTGFILEEVMTIISRVPIAGRILTQVDPEKAAAIRFLFPKLIQELQELSPTQLKMLNNHLEAIVKAVENKTIPDIFTGVIDDKFIMSLFKIRI